MVGTPERSIWGVEICVGQLASSSSLELRLGECRGRERIATSWLRSNLAGYGEVHDAVSSWPRDHSLVDGPSGPRTWS